LTRKIRQRDAAPCNPSFHGKEGVVGSSPTPGLSYLSRTWRRTEVRRLLISRDDHVQLNFGAGAIVGEHHICKRRTAEPGGVLALADVDRGPLASIPDDYPDLLTLVKTLAHPVAFSHDPSLSRRWRP
jgi:hypothetical protein